MYRYINCSCLETPLLQTLIILWTRVNFLWLRKGKVAFLRFFIYIRYRSLGKLFQATLTWRWNINWPILHLCFPSGPDEQLQSLSINAERIEKINNHRKISVCKSKSVWSQMATSDGSLGIRYIQDGKGIVHLAPHQRSYRRRCTSHTVETREQSKPCRPHHANACSDRWPFDLCIEIHILSV